MRELIISGPGKNALGSELMEALIAQVDAAGGEPLLVTGAGDAFSAGLNLKEVGSLDAEGMERFLNLLDTLSAKLFDYPGPTVALVNGHAIAGGCILALVCDERIGAANPKAKIGLNELALGLRFPPKILRVVRYALGGRAAERAILSAGLFSPEDARDLGMLDVVREDAEAYARGRLEALAKIPAAAYAVAKQDLRGGLTDPNPAEEKAFKEEVLPVWTSSAVKETIAGFFKK